MDEEHQRQADELEREADQLETRSEQLGDEIKDVREDWEAKKSSEQTPGAADPEAAAPGGLGEQDDSEEAAEDGESDSG